ncbi:MAG: hypothetical protein DME13_05965, partial [Candidatus Rokuibacteriota bacterium]
LTPASLFSGIAFIRYRRLLLGLMSLDLFAVLLGGATALLPIYARDILGTGPWGLGLLRAAPACGALAMSVVLTRRPVERGAGPAFFAGVFVYGAATIVFGVSTSLGLSLAALAVLGASDLLSVVIRQSLVQIRTPDDMRGRVSAVHSLFTGTSNQLGEFESGGDSNWPTHTRRKIAYDVAHSTRCPGGQHEAHRPAHIPRRGRPRGGRRRPR